MIGPGIALLIVAFAVGVIITMDRGLTDPFSEPMQHNHVVHQSDVVERKWMQVYFISTEREKDSIFENVKIDCVIYWKDDSTWAGQILWIDEKKESANYN